MIRTASEKDMPALLKVYQKAKEIMAATGNPGQWPADYPECVLEKDIRKGNLYVVCSEDGEIHAAFAFIIGDDPTYAKIEEGQWGSDTPYGTIHRLGSDGERKGVFSECLNFCKGVIPHIRADTHKNNQIMQRLLERQGFVRRGIIHVADGSPRLAYELGAEQAEGK